MGVVEPDKTGVTDPLSAGEMSPERLKGALCPKVEGLD